MRTIINKYGTKVAFDFSKIKKALNSAFQDTMHIECPKEVVVYAKFLTEKCKTVDEIQNEVINALINYNYAEVAKAYTIYNYTHKADRQAAKHKLDFINNFVKTNNTADATIDDNSNVNNHNVAVLNAEIHKEDNLNTNYYIWEQFMRKLYPDFDIKTMRKDFKTILYPHDSSSQIMMPYCMAVSMYPFLLSGLKELGGKSAVPKSTESFCGIYINLIFALASEVKGAVATPEVLLYLNYFLEKDFGEDYYKNLNKVITNPNLPNQKTIEKQIDQYLQQIVYSINQVASSRGSQSPFTNFSLFDTYFFKGMFEDFVFPDGTKPHWESFNWLQQHFLHWFNLERLKCILTFPVVSYACLTENGDFKDKQAKEFICKELAAGNSFFIYNSDSVDSLSSCCFSKDQKILWKSSTSGVNLTTFEELYNLPYDNNKENIKFFHNGSWIKGKLVKLPGKKMFKVTTFNNKEIIVTEDHINPTFDGDKPTDKLTTNDYLLFNNVALQGVTENSEHLTYAQGYAVGAFLGDGSFGSEINGIIYDINYSQNVNKVDDCVKYVNQANKDCGDDGECTLNKVYNNVYPIRISSKKLVAFIMKWTNWFRGTYSYNKKLNLNCLLQSYEFRRGILDGWYNTDGGNSNRCYTTSKELAENMEVLIISLGLNSIVNISDRTDEKVIIRGEEYNRNYPLYCIKWYESGTHRKNKDVNNSWKKKNNSIYFKIKTIEPVEYDDFVYCIDTQNLDEPYFTLPNGIITHNCRLRNMITANTFTTTNGQIGIMTGSKNVITLDLNRIIQDYYTIDSPGDYTFRDAIKLSLKEYLVSILDRVYKYQTAYNKMLHWAYDNNLLNAYKAGFINLDKQYLTIGINGLNQAAEFLGIKCNKNDLYKDFCSFIFNTIKEQNTLHKTDSEMFNTEMVPAESAAIKLYDRDKKDGYWVPSDTNLYASYVFKPNDLDISILDKMYLHSSKFANQSLDGGSACHINLKEHLSTKQYEQLLSYAAKVGCNYFTFNVPNCECEDCGFIAKQPFNKCPRCGSTKISLWDRVN